MNFNNKFSFKMMQKSYLKAKKCSKFHRQALLDDRMFKWFVHTKVKVSNPKTWNPETRIQLATFAKI